MNFNEFLKDSIVFLDGGMGTLLQARGLCPGERPELWNITHENDIIDIHRAYFDAGSNVVNTNTFGANALNFNDDELEAVIKAAVKNAKTARDKSIATGEKFVSLDIGPSGKLLKPYGDLDFEDAVELFAKTVRIGVECGVDLVTIETMNDSYETKAALLAVKENCDLPVIVTNAYGEDGKLMTGASPEAMAALLEGMGASAIGANCSLGPKKLIPVIKKLLDVSSVPVIIKANAGIPKSVDGKTVFDVDASEFASDVKELVECGVRIVGGCCGTTPEYIRAIKDALRNTSPLPVTEKDLTVVSSYTHAVSFGSSPILIGERINPTGKKRFKQALLENDINYILNEGLEQSKKGVHILDVNVGLPDIDEVKMLTTTVTELQSVTDLPLQIDTSNTMAMECALRRYNGKAMINSVNGKAENMKAIFPLVKKYGGVVVALTLDENGIPNTKEGRTEIAKKIIKTAEEYGINKKNIVFDTLAMAVSADNNSANATLGALNYIKNDLGCHTSLGVSNISFGLPNRDIINSTFFALALENGLSAAIMNPYSAEMMKTYYSYCVLRGFDENCLKYISVADSFNTSTQANALGNEIKADATTLKDAIIKGLHSLSGKLTENMLKDNPPLDIVNSHIIPALDVVGKSYEEKKVYLPNLLMSAEAAKSAFEIIKKALPSDNESKKGKIIVATVEGDIHDIGKNIVKLLLENYGFSVIDLGKDVPVQTVVDTAKDEGVTLVGLSALMTTTVPAMETTIKALHESLADCKIVVGGAVLNEEYAKKIGADKYASDAMETVRYAEEHFSNLKKTVKIC